MSLHANKPRMMPNQSGPVFADTVPVLETPRLLMRGHRVEDFKALLSFWSDPAVTCPSGVAPLSEEDVWGRLLRYAGLWSLLGFGYWAVTDKASGQLLGDLGFADYHRDLVPSLDGRPEIGWIFATGAHGRGLASEAALAAVGWADRHWGAATTVCVVNTTNPPSLRIAAKCGYREYARSTYRDLPAILFERPGRPQPGERESR
jgi:RimJ/RimL family protein N-acetyltransferase